MVVLRSPSGMDTVQAMMFTIFLWIEEEQDIDLFRKYQKLEQLRDNCRTIVTSLGYRCLTHSLTLMWQSLTAVKMWLEHDGNASSCPDLRDNASLLVEPEGMGNILTQAHIGSLRDIAGHDRLLVQLVGPQELTRQFVLRADQEITKQIFTDAFDTIWDVLD